MATYPARMRRHRQQTKPAFVRPVPVDWLYRAMRLPGKSLHVAVELWRQCGVKSSLTFKFSIKPLRDCQITHPTIYQGLEALEAAGLVRVTRNRGALSTVTILTDQVRDKSKVDWTQFMVRDNAQTTLQ